MSQRVVEETLGRLLCDDAFRRELEHDFDAAVLRHGLELTASERESLRRVRWETLAQLADRLDDRIRRADLEYHLDQGRGRGDRHRDTAFLRRLTTCRIRQSH